MEDPVYYYLFGGNNPTSVVFYGDLDITALGGAGFASQRSVDALSWDLAAYQGLSVGIRTGDAKKYTVILKDSVLPKRPDGREQSTVSWEYDFEVSSCPEIVIPWHAFRPTYRGKPKPDAEPLAPGSVKRIGIMCRSFFGEQEGPFRLELDHIAAVTSAGLRQQPRPQPQAELAPLDSGPKEKGVGPKSQSSQVSLWLGWFGKLVGWG
ncbi:hypothetical protein SLS62_010917 [Diatrype stigma]|uniref:NADH:ubiquinone oxidoreductase intermediate-associated protein 30 domain-containing protein n=1 Tax=Diatrype stigma TaxID=117547 RepID=A0AAN9U8T4_9PEZI